MQQVAKGVWQISGLRHHHTNAYLVEDVLVDAGTRWSAPRLLAALAGRPLSLVALTHCHPDHQGSAAAICQARGVPLACHAADRASVEGRRPMQPESAIMRLGELAWAGPPLPVGRELRAGDLVGGFRVVPTPGHTPGHLAFFREADGVAISGDLLNNIHPLTGAPRLGQPPPLYTVDPAQNRASIRALLALDPALVCFGHGPPLADPALLREYIARLG